MLSAKLMTKIGPVLAEIDRKVDTKRYMYTVGKNDALYNTPFFNGLGSKEDISNLTVDELKEFYETYYRPSNQVLLISGKFDDNIIDLIECTYSKYKFKDNKVEKMYIEEYDKVNNDFVSLKTPLNQKLFNLTYKINISKLSTKEKNKLDYYTLYIFENNFDEKSKFFADLYHDKTILFPIYRGFNAYTKDYVSLSLEAVSNDLKHAEELFLDKMNNLSIDEKSFTKWKNKTILRNINKSENIFWISDNYINNYLEYDLEEADDIDFINSLTFEECKNYLAKLDLSNYSIVENIGQE